MKKFILMCALAFGMIAMQSCKETQVGVMYSLTAVGDANGNVEFGVPVGRIALDGTANLDAVVTNDSTNLVFGAVNDGNVMALSAGLESQDKKVVEQATSVDNWFTKNFRVTTGGGDYYVRVTGFVKEKVTGLTFQVDKVFTNRANDAVAPTSE